MATQRFLPYNDTPPQQEATFTNALPLANFVRQPVLSFTPPFTPLVPQHFSITSLAHVPFIPAVQQKQHVNVNPSFEPPPTKFDFTSVSNLNLEPYTPPPTTPPTSTIPISPITPTLSPPTTVPEVIDLTPPRKRRTTRRECSVSPPPRKRHLRSDGPAIPAEVYDLPKQKVPKKHTPKLQQVVIDAPVLFISIFALTN